MHSKWVHTSPPPHREAAAQSWSSQCRVLLGFSLHPKGVVFSFLFSTQGCRQHQEEVAGDLAGLALCSEASYERGQLSLLLLDGCMRTACAGPHHAACLHDTQPSTALLDCKSSIRLSMPEDVTAVAHGDAITVRHTLPRHAALPCIQRHLN
jgi:hypothetical protein